MEKIKFILFSIITLVILGILGYWAVVSIQSGASHVSTQAIKDLKKENEDLKEELKNLSDEIETLKTKLGETNSKEEEELPEVAPISVSTYKHQSLIDDLQKLIDDNISMKIKSNGTRVGVVQNFLNIYNKTSNKVDNDYGAGTQKAVIKFQKDQGIIADGEASTGTFNKMIDWLKKQN